MSKDGMGFILMERKSARKSGWFREIPKITVAIFLSIIIVACVKNPNQHEITVLETKIAEFEKVLQKNEEILKGTSLEEGLKNQLAQDNALLASRVERLKEKIKYLQQKK